jgi:hypothetical protein
MSEAEDPTKNVKDQRSKVWHDKRMRKRGCILERKLMNSSSKESFK